ncbi:MAG: 4Fe-4S binding protein, partial [Butyrivibrio sp.]|nr:4Fe-4S binding protein [Butyrivibrio sp.]
SRHHAIAAKVPVLEPSDSAEALAFTKLAFDISERFDTPVIIKMCTRVAHSQSVVETYERYMPEKKPYQKDIAKYVMVPGNAKKRHPVVEERTKRLKAYFEEGVQHYTENGRQIPLAVNRIEMRDEAEMKSPFEKNIGFITSSTSYQYVKEVFGNRYSVLKLGVTNPLPDELITEFAEEVDRVVVVEELDPVIEAHVKSLGIKCDGKNILPVIDEFSQNLIADAMREKVPEGKTIDEAIPVRPPVMCAGCPHRGLFYTLHKNKCTVLGDIGCYTLGSAAPLSAMEMTLCMGASLSAAHGFVKASGKDAEKKTVAVIGDSTFMHSGMTGLANIAYNQSNTTVIILDNSITGMTGHQQNPTTGFNIKGDPAGKIDLEALCRAMGIEHVRTVDPYDLDATDEAVKEELAFEGPSVIITRRPCVLLKYVKPAPPLHVSPETCVGCTACMKIGCPAISVKEGEDGKKHAVVDETLCTGCGVCVQMCKFGAFTGMTEEGIRYER